MNNDYYSILGVSRTATTTEIKTRFRFLSHAYHPDKFGSVDHKQTAEEEFKRINSAYQTLSDPSQRARYDLSKPEATSPPPRYEQPTASQTKGDDTHSPRQTEPIIAVTSRLAKWSFWLGVTGVFVITGILGIVAIICGHRALLVINSSEGALKGRGYAIAGLVLGYLELLLMIFL